jgi:hypothetical protein
MGALSRRAGYVLAFALLVSAVGCSTTENRTANQGGGNLITAATKLSSNRISELTPDEWQILIDNAPTIAAQFGIDLGALASLPQLSDEEAAALAELMIANGVNSFTDLQQLIDGIVAGTVTVPQALVDLAEELADSTA